MSDARRKKRHPAPPESTAKRIARAQDRTALFIEAAMLTVLLDKYGFDREQLQGVLNETEKLCTEIGDGTINVKDLCNVLRDEYDINLVNSLLVDLNDIKRYNL